jgi:hypothetical protein
MSENNVALSTEKQDYQKPVVKKMGTASELTMASPGTLPESFDSGGNIPNVYS